MAATQTSALGRWFGRLTPTPVYTVLDLEAQVYTARLEHELVEWKSRKWIAWLLFVVLLLGWVHAFDNERRFIASHIEMLQDAGPPLECFYNSNDPNHPIPLSLQVSYWLSVQDPADVCHKYYAALARSRWPNAWVVTVKYTTDTVIVPIQSIIKAVGEAPWLIQVLLVFALATISMVYIALRISHLPSLFLTSITSKHTHRE